MASQWAFLKGKVPEKQPTARDLGLAEELRKIDEADLGQLTQEYNDLWKESDDLAALTKANKLKMDAREIMIRKRLAAKGVDGAMVNGYTWTEKFEPYPVCKDPGAIVAYLREHDPAQLNLTNTELASRLKAKVKEEAKAGELIIETQPDPNNPGEDVTIVRSQVPGVEVFLKTDLSRVKSSKKE